MDAEARSEPAVPPAKPAPTGPVTTTARHPFGIFISYRRDDSAGHTGRLYDKLAHRFGDRRVFMDINAIQPGMDFRSAIDGALSSSSVVLAIIGKRWLESLNGDGARRLDEPNDLVRLEISSALRQGMDVIPVLVQRASMPSAERLPEDIRALTWRHAIEIDDTRWDQDVERLVLAIERSRGKTPDARQRTPIARSAKLGAALALVLAVGLGAFLFATRSGPVGPATSQQPSISIPGSAAATAAPPVSDAPPSAAPSFGSVLFEDELSGPVAGLSGFRAPSCGVTVTAGLSITARGTNHLCAASTAAVDPAIAALQDVSVEVDVLYSTFTASTSKFGPGDAAIACRFVGTPSEGNYYIASLSPVGYWSVDRFVGGVQKTLDVGRDPTLAMQKGMTRRLRLDCAGPTDRTTTLTFSIDSRPISTVLDPTGLDRGSVALAVTSFAEPEIEAAFHRLVIRGP